MLVPGALEAAGMVLLGSLASLVQFKMKDLDTIPELKLQFPQYVAFLCFLVDLMLVCTMLAAVDCVVPESSMASL